MPNTDVFQSKVTIAEGILESKRTVISEISTLFDPLGWISPVLITLKVSMQNLGKLAVTWETVLPNQVIENIDPIGQI